MNRTLVRRIWAGLLGVTVVAIVSWGLDRSYEEERVDFMLTVSAPLYPKAYHVSLDSIDEVAGRIRVRAQVALNRTVLILTKEARDLLTPEEIEKLPAYKQIDSIKISFGPIELEDLSENYRALGLWFVQRSGFHRMQPESSFTPSVPSPVQRELFAIGNPTFYPFDQYVVMGRVSCEAFASTDGKNYIALPSELYDVDFRIPGFTLRNATGAELQKWDDATTREVNFLKQRKDNTFGDKSAQLNLLNQGYKSDSWSSNQFALVLGRPFFLKFIACFLAVPALLSIIFVCYIEDPKRVLLNAVGYFLALWAVRQALSVDAPRTATAIDYATLVLYAILIAAVLARFAWGFKTPDIET
jgi:hypothetical protein